MEGNLQLSPGTTLQTGYDFTTPGNHLSATVNFIAPQVTFALTCVSGATPSSSTLVVPMPSPSYTDTQGDPSWYPSGDQNSSLVYQGSISEPDVCSGGTVSFKAGGTFSTGISSMDTTDKVNVRWHYSGTIRGFPGDRMSDLATHRRSACQSALVLVFSVAFANSTGVQTPGGTYIGWKPNVSILPSGDFIIRHSVLPC
jgi:hypothetical protein